MVGRDGIEPPTAHTHVSFLQKSQVPCQMVHTYPSKGQVPPFFFAQSSQIESLGFISSSSFLP